MSNESGMNSTRQQTVQARLAALADGTLPASERERLLATIAQSPELAAALERQRRATAMLDTLREVPAPETLHRSVAALASPATPRPRRRSAPRPLLAAGALAAVAIVTIAIALSAGSTVPPPTVAQAAIVGLGPATQPAPAISVDDPAVLDRSAAGIAFPNWRPHLGWQPAGARSDRLAGRAITTVFYLPADSTGGDYGRVGYAIVSGRALALPDGKALYSHGIAFHAFDTDGATVVTWRRAGHTCILVARSVDSATLTRLASWQ
jgi:hypothetical protein